ncbi:MAG: hypothetical protein KKD39_01250, partial [Candidatus Altiarchaeota archaeon]|nr:hypothetical protein [Candidatus Altiarchaeota archaeon]
MGDDEFDHISRGVLLAKGLTPYKDFYVYSPGMMLIAAIPHLFLAKSYVLLRALTGAVDFFNIILLYLYGKKIFNREIGYMAALMYLFNYVTLWNSALYMGEPYGVFLILAGLYAISSKKYFFASIFFSATTFIKPHYTLFWIPVVVYLTYTKMHTRKVLIYPVLLTVIIVYLLSIYFDDSVSSMWIYYFIKHSSSQTVFSINNIMVNSLILLIYLVVFETSILLVAQMNARKLRGMRINEIHIYAASSIFFIFFPSLFPHHLQLTMPAVYLVVAQIVSTQWKKMMENVILMILFALIVSLPAHIILNGYPPAPYKKENVYLVVNYIKNLSNDERILSDFGFYSYFSEVDDVLNTGFHLGEHNQFNHEFVEYTLDKTKPRLIIISVKHAYPTE